MTNKTNAFSVHANVPPLETTPEQHVFGIVGVRELLAVVCHTFEEAIV